MQYFITKICRRDSIGYNSNNSYFKSIVLDEDSDCLKAKIALAPKRSEPSSRDFLIGEQPNPWDLLQPQDKSSRHRGAELRRRYGLLGGTSLLSPE